MNWLKQHIGWVLIIISVLTLTVYSHVTSDNYTIGDVYLEPGKFIMISWDASPADVNRALQDWLKNRPQD